MFSLVSLLIMVRKHANFVKKNFNRTGCSVNTWVESPRDEEVRVGEALVRLHAASFAKTFSR
jgi:hypothetical protein